MSLLKEQRILLVLDPNWRLCYDSVDVDNFTRAGLLPWVAQLKDELTIGPHNPEGSYLEAGAPFLRSTCFSSLHGLQKKLLLLC